MPGFKTIDQTLDSMMPSRMQMFGRQVAQDPNIHRLMAGIGTELDPHGMGGMIGRPTMDMIEGQAHQDTMAQLAKALGKGGKVIQKPDGTSEIQVGEGARETDQPSGLVEDVTDMSLGGLDKPVHADTDYASAGTDVHPQTQQKIGQAKPERRQQLERVVSNSWWNRRKSGGGA